MLIRGRRWQEWTYEHQDEIVMIALVIMAVVGFLWGAWR